jgi:hypothetical protein
LERTLPHLFNILGLPKDYLNDIRIQIKKRRNGIMNFLRAGIVVLVIIVGLNFVGCCGGSKETKETERVIVPQSTVPTLGKQLEDLEDAYKKGAITKAEFETAKKKLIEQGAQPSK